MYNEFDVADRYGIRISNSFERIERILKQDKLAMPKMIETLIKKDIMNVVAQYLKVSDDKCNFDLQIADNGAVLVRLECIAEKIIANKKLCGNNRKI